MVIRQGDIFWARFGLPVGSEPGGRRPVVVVQNDLLNRSLLRTVVVCAMTSNMKWAHSEGNVLLGKGEANLPRRSVVNVTQLATINKTDLLEKIGTLSTARLGEVLDGIGFLIKPR